MHVSACSVERSRASPPALYVAAVFVGRGVPLRSLYKLYNTTVKWFETRADLRSFFSTATPSYGVVLFAVLESARPRRQGERSSARSRLTKMLCEMFVYFFLSVDDCCYSYYYYYSFECFLRARAHSQLYSFSPYSTEPGRVRA